MWGVSIKDKIYCRKADNSSWQNISGELRQVSVAADGTVWGVNGKGEIYRRKNDDSGWINIISSHNVYLKLYQRPVELIFEKKKKMGIFIIESHLKTTEIRNRRESHI